LGFQVANTFTNAFEQLPPLSRSIHLVSLVCVAVSAVFLIAPAAYHRIAEHGEDSEEFYQLSGRFLLAALFWLALGICGDLWVVIRIVSRLICMSMPIMKGSMRLCSKGRSRRPA